MPTYVYHVLGADGEASNFEVRQSFHDAPLAYHPQTGEPVRRVISGGLGFFKVRSRGNITPTHSGGSNQNCCPGCND